MNSNIDSRNIRVFISSTFSDMQDERDELVSKVFPLLRKKAKERLVTISDIDLRWGITEKQSQENKVVQICLEEIDRSRPFFIGLLGGRYGWCPCEENVDWHKVISKSYGDAICDLYDGKSMTELEIRYGIFSNYQGQNAIFYLREMPLEDIEPRQKELRSIISAQTDFPVRTYKSINELALLVIDDFVELLDKYFPEESCNTWEALNIQQQAYLERCLRYYVSTPKTETEISDFFNQKEKKGLIISGESGIGKSTILAKITSDLSANKNIDVLSFFPTNSSNGSSFSDLSDWFCQGFESIYGFDYDRNISHITELQRAASVIKPSKKLVLIIDGINQIVSSTDAKSDLVWWPIWDDNVYVIFSTPENTEIFQNLKRFGYKTLYIKQLNLDQRVELSYNYLKRDFNKSLSVDQLEYIGHSNPLLDNTLLFVSLLDELRKFGSFEELTHELSLMTSFKTIVEFFEFVIKKQCNLISSKEKYESVLSAITVSYKGLSESTLISLTGISRLDLSILLGINELNLTIRDGRVVFAHDAFRNAVINMLLNDKEKERSAREKIIKFYRTDNLLQDKSWEKTAGTILNDNIVNDESLFELLFQYYNLGYYDDLFVLLSNMQTYNKYSSSGKLNELGLYWTKLISINPFRYDILNIIFNEMATAYNGAEAAIIGLIFYAITSCQSSNIINLSNFISLHMRTPESGKRLLHALVKMLENGDSEDYKHLREIAKQNIANTISMQGDYLLAIRKYLDAFNDAADMSEPSICSIGELMLSLYEQSNNKSCLTYAQDILKDVLASRIKKYNTEYHEDVAVAYANYGAAISHTNLEYGLELQQKSLDIYEKIKGHYHIDVAIQNHNIAQELIDKNIQKAAQLSEKALVIFQKLLGENAEDTMIEHRALAIIYAKQHENHKSWQHCLAMSDYMWSDPEREKTMMSLLRKLLAGFYHSKDYEKAEEVGLYALSCISQDSLSAIDFHNDMGKIYRVKGLLQKSEYHYEKALQVALNNGLYDKALQTLAYYAQIYFAEGDMENAQIQLRRIIEISEDNHLEDSLMLAYAYFNIGLCKYNQGADQGEIIKLIEQAISIREKLVDGDDDDLVEYRNTLERFRQKCKHTGIDETCENSRHAIEVMTDLLDGCNPCALEAFTEGMIAFDAGNMDNAMHKLEIAKSYLNENDDTSAYAHVMRYLAYCDELIYLDSDGKRGDPSEIINKYNDAISLAQSDSNFSLAKEISHDAAMYCYSLGEYEQSEICHWREFENLLASDRLITIDTSVTLFNIAMTLFKQKSNDTKTLFALTLLALFVYEHCGVANEELRSNLEDNYNYLKEYISNYDDLQIASWGISIWVLFEHVQQIEQFKTGNLVSLMLKLSLDYNREFGDKKEFAFIDLHYIISLINQHKYASAIQELELLMSQYKQYLGPENAKTADKLYYIVYIAVHDFERAESIRETFAIPDEIVREYMNYFTPCFYAMFAHDEAAAEIRYSELLDLQNNGRLLESQYYDLALYCAIKQMPYESKKYMDLWLQCPEIILERDYYKPAMNFLTNLNEYK